MSQNLSVTDEMIAAYLKANDEYWHKTDALPSTAGKWRTGNVKEATRVSLQAAIAAILDAPESAPTPKEPG